MCDSIGIIELDTSHNRSLAGVGKETRKKYGGCSREVDTMNVLHRITRSRGLVLMTPTTPTMIMTCAVDQAESIHQDMKEYVPDQIPMKEVINFLIRCI